MPTAVDTYAIGGTAFIWVGTKNDVGTSVAFSLLGYTEKGVDMRIVENKTEIMTDLFGDKTPQDYQDMGMVGEIVAPLIAYDSAVLASIIGRGDRTTWGSLNTPGLPLFQFGYGFPVVIATPLAAAIPANLQIPTTPGFNAGTPWYFYKCLLKTEGQRLATKANPFLLELIANPWVPFTATTGRDAPLFTRALATP